MAIITPTETLVHAWLLRLIAKAMRENSPELLEAAAADLEKIA